MGTSSDFIKRCVHILNPVLFAIGAACLFLPFYRIEQGGHIYSHTVSTLLSVRASAALLVISPVFGLVFHFLFMSKRTKKQREIPPGIIHAVGLLLLFVAKPIIFEYGDRFYSMAFGAVVTLIAYAVGILANGIALLMGRKAQHIMK